MCSSGRSLSPLRSTLKVPDQVPLPKTAAECRRQMEALGCGCQTYLNLLKEHLLILEQREQQG